MTEKEAFLNMIRKATRNRYERSQFKDCWPDYSEFEKIYFEGHEGNIISVSNADEDDTFFHFDDDGNLMFID